VVTLAGGVLTGKYTRADLDHGGGSTEPYGTRKNLVAASGALSERGLAIADVIKKVAADIGATPSQVALASTMHNPAVTAPIIGARTPAQLADNLGALEVRIPDDALASLEEASAIQLGFPHDFLARPTTRHNIFGEIKLETC
jgi:aryl-alcohol dehydrogenase-like predicted oxidoreductase